MNDTKYTFLLPAYKARYLEEALLSIQSQSYTDYKVLVSDDCSPEDLKSVFDKVCGDDSRFTYRRNEKNMGGASLVSHWNLLVNMCDTEWLIMASDDDVYEPSFLEEIDKLAEKYPQVDILRARARRIENGKVVREDGEIKELMCQKEFIQYFGIKEMVLCLANYVFKMSALKGMGGFPDFPTAAFSDSATAIFLSKNGIATTENVLFTFRISDENLSCAKNYDRNTEKGVIANIMFLDWFKEKFNNKYPYNSFAYGIEQYHFPRLTFRKMCYYFTQFWRRGYMTEIRPNLTIIKNWFKFH